MNYKNKIDFDFLMYIRAHKHTNSNLKWQLSTQTLTLLHSPMSR